MNVMDRELAPVQGQLRRHEVLGSVATYEIVSVTDDVTVVRVVSAPGLEPGHQLRLTTDAVAAMPVVDSA
jgi:hypothetical protein